MYIPHAAVEKQEAVRSTGYKERIRKSCATTLIL